MEESRRFGIYSELPELTKYDIAEEYDYETLRAFCQSSNREALELCNDNAFWKRKTYHDFGDLYDIEKFEGNWRDIYEYYRGFFSWDLIKDLEDDNTDAIEKKMVVNRVGKFLNVNGQEEEGKTALMLAASRDYGVLVRELLELGSNPNLQDDNGKTALMYASEEGYTDIIRELLAAGADPDLQTENGDTALMLASSEGEIGAVRVLLVAGADPNIRNNPGFTALVLAIISSRDDIVLVLLENGADPNISNRDGFRALYFAINQSNPNIVRDLLRYGADIENRDNITITSGDYTISGLTPLIWATFGGQTRTVRILLNEGADPFHTSRSGQTALEVALARRDNPMHPTPPEIIDMLMWLRGYAVNNS